MTGAYRTALPEPPEPVPIPRIVVFAGKYPKFPDHSLPPGPKPAPNPALPADCVCGSPWIEQHAGSMIAGMAVSANPKAVVTTKDAFHDVSDVHPFHLPHIFNACKVRHRRVGTARPLSALPHRHCPAVFGWPLCRHPVPLSLDVLSNAE